MFTLRQLVAILLILPISYISCKKDEEEEPPPPTAGCFDAEAYTDQLPNLDYERWGSPLESAGKYEEPCGGIWASGNAGVAIAGLTTTSKTTDAKSGQFAARMETVLALGLISGGSVFTGRFELNLNDPSTSAKLGVPFTRKPLSVSGFYKYTSVNGDSANIRILLSKYNSQTKQRDTVGFGEMPEYNTISEYTAFDVPVDYSYPMGSSQPDSIVLTYTSSKGAEEFKGEVGSTLFIDDVQLNY